MLFDQHIHTDFSGDCAIPVEKMIETGIKNGLSGMTITDHMDLDYPPDPSYFVFDTDAYEKRIQSVRETYETPDFSVGYGIELGLSQAYDEKNSALVKDKPYDFVIASLHMVRGIDIFYNDYYEGRRMEEAITEYFQTTLNCVRSYNDFDALGHLDYIIRYARSIKGYEQVHTLDLPVGEIIDEILLTLIKKDKALEVNTGPYRKGMDVPNPHFDILKRYYDLGGRALTLGSDAHHPDFVAQKFETITTRLKEIGFESYLHFIKRTPNEIGL